MGGVTDSDAIAELSPNRDFYGWAMAQARLLRAGRLSELDVENIAEEIESMGRGERRELTNRVAVLLTHLLKWEYQPERRGRGWSNTIGEQRDQAALLLRENPSLRPMLPEIIANAHNLAIRAAARETGLPRSRLPASCPYSFHSMLHEDFWPGQPSVPDEPAP